jgi:phospholipid-binding lipoprotein MlaA
MSKLPFRHVGIVLAVLLLLVGCSTLPHTGPNTLPPLRTYEEVVKEGEGDLLNVPDSIEGFNRGAYRFNYYFDRYLLRPIVRGYEFVMPEYAQDRVSSALDNIGEFGNLTNNLLQLKLKGVGITLGRFVINSTVGVAGLWDPATGWGLARQTQDFGRTLAHYGAGNGSYVVLPIFGPSNLRDTAGLAVDATAFSLVGPIAWANEIGASVGHAGLNGVDRRHRIHFEYRDTGSPFEYELLRSLYTVQRELEVQSELRARQPEAPTN